MAAAELTEAFVGGVAPHEQKTGQGLKCLSYTATVATQNDWVILGDFTVVTNVYCEIVASGVLNPCTIDGTTTNKVVLTSATTGDVRLIAWGY